MTATVVASGPAALEALTAAAQEHQPFELVLLDANMPDMDGFEVAAEVAKRPELSRRHHHDAELVGRLRRSAALRRSSASRPTSPSRSTPPICWPPSNARSARSRRRAAAARPEIEGRRPGQGRRWPARRASCSSRTTSSTSASPPACSTRRGHHVTVAQNGSEALARLDVETFDLVLMDLQMPVMGGTRRDRRDSRARARHGPARPHRRHDGARDEQRSRAVPGRGHGRLSLEADRSADAVRRRRAGRRWRRRARRRSPGRSRSTRTRCGAGSPATTN